MRASMSPSSTRRWIRRLRLARTTPERAGIDRRTRSDWPWSRTPSSAITRIIYGWADWGFCWVMESSTTDAKRSWRAITTCTPGGGCSTPLMCSTSTTPATIATAGRCGWGRCAHTWISNGKDQRSGVRVRLLHCSGGLGLRIRLGVQRDNHLIGLDVMHLAVRRDTDGVRVGLETLDALAQESVFLLQVVDVLAQLPILGALLLPRQQAILAVNSVPDDQHCQRDGYHRRYWAPHLSI